MQHLTKMILDRAEKFKNRKALFYKEADSWHGITWNEMAEQIKAVSTALLECGLKNGDRAAIYSQNKPKWTISDYGTMGVGCITTTIYATSTAEAAEFIVNDSEASIIFAGGQEQYDNVLKFYHDNKFLKKVVVFDSSVKLAENENIVHFKDFIKSGSASAKKAEFEQRLNAATEDDTAMIIYTSGTSGVPKGVMLTHANIFSQMDELNLRFNIGKDDIELCFLPLSHSYQKSSAHWTQSNGVTLYYCENPKEIMEYFQDVRPTFMVGVPRLYEKMFAAVYAKLEKASGFKNALFSWAVKTGKEYQYKVYAKQSVSPLLKLRHKLADIAVLKKIQAILGGRLNFFSAGGAPLSAEIEEFFFAAGIFIAQGYGLTETSPVISFNHYDKFKFGTPGTPVSTCQVKIAEDGEILVKGPNVMKGYFKRPDLTAEVFTEDGWFKTGDVGTIDEEGFLHITDRIKDIIITAGGKNIAPQSIEKLFAKDYYVEQAAVIGEGRKFISALIVPNFEALQEYAENQKIKFDNFRDLIKNSDIIAFYNKRIEELSQSLARYEQIKKFQLLPEPFSQEKGEITATLKLKRRGIAQNYMQIINGMYV